MKKLSESWLLLTCNPNVPDRYGETPLHVAVCSGHTEIVKFLATLTNNLNCRDRDGATPIYYAARQGHTEIVKILVRITNNPNAPNKHGVTPFAAAKRAEIRGILEAFETPRKCKAGSSIKSHTRFLDELIYHFKNNVKKIYSNLVTFLTKILGFVEINLLNVLYLLLKILV